MSIISTDDGQTHDEREGLTGNDASPEWATFRQSAYAALKPIASLKLTVVLFALAIFIVLAGTFAQVNHDIWKVVHDYFRIDFARVGSPGLSLLDRISQFFVWIDFQIFVPPAFVAGTPPDLPSWFGIWFPKGWTIGAVMMLNLFAAHLVRFRVQTTGSRLMIGIATIGLGCLVTALVIMSGHDADGVQSASPVTYEWLWRILQMSLVGTIGLAMVFLVNSTSEQKTLRWMLIGTAVAAALGEVAMLYAGSISDSSMRILYQLVQGLLAGSVLLAGCIIVFKKRAGIVLLHAGIGLVMVYDVLVGTAHVESQMMIEEGQQVSYTADHRTAEFAIVDRSDPDQDWHTVVPLSLLESGETISDDRLPFDVEIVKLYPNSDLVRITPEVQAKPDFDNPATKDVGERFVAVPMNQSAGTDTDSKFDSPSAYVTLHDKTNGESLGTWVVSTWLQPPFFTGGAQTVEVDGKSYDLLLRHKRIDKPYRIELLDVQKNDYIGTDDVRDYRSIIRIHEPASDTTHEHTIRMNNPLRYAGETFYQTNYYAANPQLGQRVEATGLQVVSNTGWMIPYVSCMIVMVGMLAQFVLTLMRFLNRRLATSAQMRPTDRELGSDQPDSKKAKDQPTPTRRERTWLVPVIAAGLTSLVIMMMAMPRRASDTQPAIHEFGKLPVLYQGRPQPFDSLAINALLQISDKQTFKHDSPDKKERSKSAIEWFLDVTCRPEEADKYEVFRIESLELLDRLGLERRDGFRYAVSEFREKFATLEDELTQAGRDQEAKKQLTSMQRAIFELNRQVGIYSKIQTMFTDISDGIPDVPRGEDGKPNDQAAMLWFSQVKGMMDNAQEGIGRLKYPLTVPMHVDRGKTPSKLLSDTDWLPYPLASLYAGFDVQLQQPAPPAFAKLKAILKAWTDKDVEKFNNAVADYHQLLASVSPKELAPPGADTEVSLSKTAFEAYFNSVGPFNLASWLYVVAGLLVAVSWLGWTQPLNRAAFWVIAVTFLLQTAALVGRIYISGRPPVTNLYSSAVFIGWGAALFGLVLERVYRLGIGNVIAAVVGFLTLRIAHGLSFDGDTFKVLEAVLDTQFWLATHVVCVTMGYAATFVSGALGFLYILRGVATRSLDAETERSLTRMNYGVLCFALFFSFVGTVLGGLWADDSWGRFWGWDPKENGALIIVLWNALVLHARWDGMIKGRGLAVLTALGAIVVSWSWFGTNELGVGLHSYGFTEGRLMKLGLFCLTALAISAVGCLPRTAWRSSQRASPPSPVAPQ